MTLRRPARPARRGLSLIEVVIALTILVLAMAAIGQLVDIGTDRGSDARAYSRGCRLAQSKMAEVESGIIDPSTGSASGQFDPTGDDAAWSYQVNSTAAAPANLYTVTVTVSRDVRGRQLQVSLTQMMFDSKLVGSSAQAEVPAADSVIAPGTSTIDGVSSSATTGGTSP